MFPYILVFIIASIYFLSSNYMHAEKNKFLLGLFFAYLAFFVGMGDMIGGYDRYIYGDGFDAIADVMRTSRNLRDVTYLIHKNEYGYFIWEVLVSLFTENRYIFILLTTLLAYILYYHVFRKYIENYPLGAILFLGLFYYFTMTYLRQVLACGIAWLSFKYIWERKPVAFFTIILIAYTFHSSAILFMPAYFISHKKYSKDFIIKMLALSLLIGLTPLPTILLSLQNDDMGGGQGYGEQIQGFRIEYVLEVIVFVYILFKNYTFISNDRKILTMLNLSFVYCAFLFIFMRFGQGGRMVWYYMFPIIYMFVKLADRKLTFAWMKPTLYFMSFFLFLRISFAWSSQNVPYKTFLTDGEPCGDGTIYELYEYNGMYTKDKFCRKGWDPVFPFIH